jgi:hypothetical protein
MVIKISENLTRSISGRSGTVVCCECFSFIINVFGFNSGNNQGFTVIVRIDKNSCT